MKHIAFFLSAQEIDKKYAEPALELIKLCVESGYGFIYGGSEYGLMKTAAAHVLALKGRITAISSEEFRHIISPEAHESFIEKDILERKRRFLEKSDAIVALPGGTGTLDEITDIIAAKKLGLHNKPIVLLNTQGFWEGLIQQLNRMHNDGFLQKNPNELIFVNDDPQKICEYLKSNL